MKIKLTLLFSFLFSFQDLFSQNTIEEKYFFQIQKLSSAKCEYYHADSDIAILALSIDPMATKLPSEDPYEAMADNPICMVDPDGKLSGAPQQIKVMIPVPIVGEVVLLYYGIPVAYEMGSGLGEWLFGESLEEAMTKLATEGEPGEGFFTFSQGHVFAEDDQNITYWDGQAKQIVSKAEYYRLFKPAQLTSTSQYTTFKMVRGLTVDVEGYDIKYKITNGKIIILDSKVTQKGLFDFVVTKEGILKIGSAHTFLAGDQAILPGQFFLADDGTVIMHANASGHFQPKDDIYKARTDLLTSLGINLSQSTQFTIQDNIDQSDAYEEFINQNSDRDEFNKLNNLKKYGSENKP